MREKLIHRFIFTAILSLLLFVPAAPVMAICVTPPSGMVSWWPGDGTANDLVGGNNGALVGAVGYAAGEVGQSFNLTGGYVQVPDTANLDITGQLTIDAWINPSALGGRVVDKITAGGADGYLLDTFGGVIRFIVGNQGLSGSFPLPTGTWSHIAGVYDGTQMRVYLNGALNGTLDTSIAIPANSLQLRIGAASDGGSQFSGLIDEVEVFNRALSVSEIQAIFNAGIDGKCKTQTHVEIPAATGNGNIILDTNPGCAFFNVATKTEPQVSNDLSYNYPYGLVEFTVNCSPADVTITFPGDISGTTYRKYGPTTPGNPATTAWYTFSNTTLNSSTSITLHLTDGGLGDDTGVDGLIVDQGGPGLPAGATPVPTMTEWGMILFMLFAGLAAVYRMRRNA